MTSAQSAVSASQEVSLLARRIGLAADEVVDQVHHLHRLADQVQDFRNLPRVAAALSRLEELALMLRHVEQGLSISQEGLARYAAMAAELGDAMARLDHLEQSAGAEGEHMSNVTALPGVDLPLPHAMDTEEAMAAHRLRQNIEDDTQQAGAVLKETGERAEAAFARS